MSLSNLMRCFINKIYKTHLILQGIINTMNALATQKDLGEKQHPQYKIQYSIYIHHDASSETEDKKGWERALITSSMNEALDKAKILYNSGKYQKIEIKKKVFDSKNKRPIDLTLKIFEDKPKGIMILKPCFLIGSLFIGSLFIGSLFGALCGLGAFALAYVLTQFVF